MHRSKGENHSAYPRVPLYPVASWLCLVFPVVLELTVLHSQRKLLCFLTSSRRSHCHQR